MHKPHKNLDVWRLAMKLAQTIYRLTSEFPIEERFGLVSQMRRAAVSIPSNLAEGAARASAKEFRNFLLNARGSLSELDTQLDLSLALGMLAKNAQAEIDDLMVRVDKMLYVLHEKKRREGSKP